MTLSQCLEEFIKDRRLRGLSEQSIADYTMIVGIFLAFVGKDLPAADLTRSDVDRYIEYQLARDDISRTTVATYTRNLKIFLRFLEKCGYAYVNTATIRIPKTPKKNVYIYSDDEIMQIYRAVRTSEEWLTLRNYGLISLMLDSGLRLSECCALKWSDIREDASLAKVIGKGSKERVVPIGKLTVRFLTAYRNACPHRSERVFVNFDGSALSGNTVKLMMYKIGKRLPFEFSAHKLRHNFATNYCLDQYDKYGKIDIYRLMVLLGHEDIATTRRYLHLANSIIAAQENISHMDRFLDAFAGI